MDIILSLDIGTSKVAAVAFDCDSRENVAVVSSVNQGAIDGLSNGRHEQSPEIIFGQCLKLLQELIESNKFSTNTVKAISISGQMHGVLLVDQELKPLTNLITWCDQRACELTEKINSPDWPVDRTGCYLHPGYGGATLASLEISSGSTALTIADYVVAKLCGVIATEPTHAASWGIMDIRNKCWDMEIIKRLQIPTEVLPKINKSSSVLGSLNYDIGLINIDQRNDLENQMFNTCIDVLGVMAEKMPLDVFIDPKSKLRDYSDAENIIIARLMSLPQILKLFSSIPDIEKKAKKLILQSAAESHYPYTQLTSSEGQVFPGEIANYDDYIAQVLERYSMKPHKVIRVFERMTNMEKIW